MKSDDCSTHVHEFCTPCDCECHIPKCEKHPFWKPDVCPYCIERKRLEDNVLHGELLDLIKLMPDHQVNDILDFIISLKLNRKQNNGQTNLL